MMPQDIGWDGVMLGFARRRAHILGPGNDAPEEAGVLLLRFLSGQQRQAILRSTRYCNFLQTHVRQTAVPAT